MKNWLFPLWVIIDILILIAVISLWITAPEYFTLNVSLTVTTLALSALLIITKRQIVAGFLKTPYFKNVSFHVVNVFFIVCILGLINYLSFKNYKEFDLTSSNRNSLTDQTIKVLEMIKAPMKFTLFSKREEWPAVLNILKLYQTQNKNIFLDAVDVDLKPELVKSKGIERSGSLVINYKNKETTFLVTDELSITNAILKLARDEEIIIYTTTGHQELSCLNKEEDGVSKLCQKLENQNYILKELNLTRVNEIPKDASAVLVLGPMKGFLDSEVKHLKNYLDQGGSVFLGLAPSFESDIYSNLVKLAEPYGLKLGKDIVVDRLSTVQGAEATIPIVTKYSFDHPITAGFNQRTVFPLSSSVQILPGNDSAILLAMTSAFPASWAESDLKGIMSGKANFDDKKDLKGPIGLLGIGESTKEKNNSRIALLGSSSFLVNAYQSQSSNTTLFLNAISWIINDEGIISFNRPGIEEDAVILSAQHLQMIFVISILAVPIIFFACAIFIYRRRKLL